MTEFRCFDSFTLNKFSSSEYIKKRKRTTLFTNAQTIAIGNSNYQKGISENSIPPGYLKKQTGGIYFKPTYIKPNGDNRCLIGAKNYETLYDVLYGAKPYNTKIQSLSSNINRIPITSQGWTGSIMQIDFKDVSNVLIGPSIATIPNGFPNKMRYPARQDFLPDSNELNPPSDFPGMVIDPCYNIFYPQCQDVPNNYVKNVRYNPNILFATALSQKQTLTFLENILYQNVENFPYPLDFSATKCLTL